MENLGLPELVKKLARITNEPLVAVSYKLIFFSYPENVCPP